ncbi:hypothetical protein MTR_7g056750 [Medicago truncatula]|uniref:Uncharacterized protein n=1 Tax=Medicago truncatula TaxID=3880 RepID=A0A072UAA5_MEDTR|nr:hypothetical protein MTR_7g056750 [Medicago truncatula]
MWRIHKREKPFPLQTFLSSSAKQRHHRLFRVEISRIRNLEIISIPRTQQHGIHIFLMAYGIMTCKCLGPLCGINGVKLNSRISCMSCRVDNEPNQLEYSSKFDSVISPLNLVHEPTELNLS